MADRNGIVAAVTITLRDYQRECLDTILSRYRAGVRRQLICLPTGTGKTVVFAHFPPYFQMKRRMLVLAHREELLDQAKDKIARANPQLTVEVEQSVRSAGTDSDVVVASVATLGRKDGKRLARFDPEQFYLLVIDEAHHATARTYRRVLDHFSMLEPETKRLLVGFTATPKRGDGQGLEQIFEEISYARSLPEMIDAGFLAPVAAYRVETDIDLTRVRSRMGDFATGQLSQTVNIRRRNDLVVQVYRDHLAGKQTVCFCVDVEHAHSLASSFSASKVAAAAVTGEMPASDRRAVLESFRSGALELVTNCMVLTEGFDEPQVSGIILARPTKSSLLYTQMIGRGTRLSPGKDRVVVIDVVDVTREHSLITLPSLFGLQQSFNMEGRTTAEVQEAISWVEENRPWVRTDLASSISDLRYRCKSINLLELELPQELLCFARFAWIAIGPDAYRLSLGGGEAVSVYQTILGRWEVTIASRGWRKAIGDAQTIGNAIRLAEAWLVQNRRGSLALIDLEAEWRRKPATDRQLERLRSMGITVPEELTRGQASHLIAMAQRRPPASTTTTTSTSSTGSTSS